MRENSRRDTGADDAPAGHDRAPSALDSADPIRNFSLSMEERVRALTIGAPAWAVRKRRIEDDVERLVVGLVAIRDKLAAQGRAPAQIALAIDAAATDYDLTKLNALVTTHNRYYPIEANLPMDRRGNYLVYGRVWRPEEPYTASRLVALAAAAIERRGTGR